MIAPNRPSRPDPPAPAEVRAAASGPARRAHPPESFSQAIDAARRDERQRAVRALLRRPLLTASQDDTAGLAPKSKALAKAGDEDFALVRRHQAYLSNWFARYTGWTFILRGDSARLVKRAVDSDDATRGAVDLSSSGGPLSRRRYVLWCLALAVLHHEGRQTTLQRLADQMMRMVQSLPALAAAGCEYDPKMAETRRGIVCVVRLLLHHGVLARVEGDEQAYIGGSGDCLYNIRTNVLTDVLSLNRPLHAAGDLAAEDRLAFLVASSAAGESDEQLRSREVEHRLIGRLLDSPIMYFDDLTEREFPYWQSQRPRLLQVVEDATGLVAEVRAEGVALLDPEGDLTDVRMPEAGTIGHATLLIGEFLAERYVDSVRSAVPNECEIPLETVALQMNRLVEEHRRHWRKGLSEPGQVTILLEDVLQRLEMLRLIRRTETGTVPLAAVCRFASDESNRDT